MSNPEISENDTPDWVYLRYSTWPAQRAGYRADCFWIAQPITVTLITTGQKLTIPAGYVTDGASVPPFLQGVFPAIGDHLLADIIHDLCYNNSILPRSQADLEFYLWMKRLRPYRKSRLDNWLRYAAVRLFGRWKYGK